MKTVRDVKLVDSRAVGAALGVQPRVVQELWLKKIIPGIKITRRALRFDLQQVILALKSRSVDE